MKKLKVFFIGPEGTYSCVLARKLFGSDVYYIPVLTILDACRCASETSFSVAVVPIENSGAGEIYETVDILISGRPKLYINEEVMLDIRLALLGRLNERIKVLYTHFAPLENCYRWIKQHLPRVKIVTVASTAQAAELAGKERGAVALAHTQLARKYELDVLNFPIPSTFPNITVFLVLSREYYKGENQDKTSLVVTLPDRPGALCSFLEIFRDKSVNLSRLISRPIKGRLGEYAFLLDVDGGMNNALIKDAIRMCKKKVDSMRILGSYPSGRMFKS